MFLAPHRSSNPKGGGPLPPGSNTIEWGVGNGIQWGAGNDLNWG